MDACLAAIDNSKDNTPGVPIHLRMASTKLMSQMDYGRGYSYDLDKVQSIEYMPEGMEKVNFFKK